jgi:hypothetical protein
MLARKKPANPGHVADARARGRLQRASRAIIAKGSGMLYRMDGSGPIKEKTLRGVKGIATALLAMIFTLAFGWPGSVASLWAQTATNPLLAPLPPPAAPAQLPAPVTTAIAPVLAPVPTPPQASPTPSARAFNCSCFGRATGTHWMGQVTAPGYFNARQAAVGACLAYNERREPQSPLQNTRASGATTVPILPGSDVPGTATRLGQTLPGALNFSTAQQLQMCSNCLCD